MGFSQNWEEASKLAATEKETLSKLSLSLYLTDPKESIVGLYYDPAAKNRQELIKLSINDVTPTVDLDKDNSQEAATNSLVNDKEVLKYFIEILQKSEKLIKESPTQEGKLRVK